MGILRHVFVNISAPTAQTETVLVCVVCHKLLQEEQGRKEKSS